MNNPDNGNDTVSFTETEWKSDDISEAFGVAKSVKKPKEKTPGVKAILVFNDSFLRAKVQMREYKNLRPAVDLPEVISAMIDVCAADAQLMALVTKNIIARREQQLVEMKAELDALKASVE